MSSILLSIWTTIKGYFDLSFQRDDEAVVIAQIRESVNFRGANSWVLIFAIFIASLGLNVNSTAVIIGAMLISPLMGPIIGLGLAIAINDLELLKQSFRNLAAATLISVLTATVYFYITPLDEAQSELLARTSPTIYDVLIALFGGAAGILALSMKGRGGNVLPGVAIATALMPPLCTAGYGLATGQPSFFFGAFYLFFINIVFIGLATFLGVRLMKFTPTAEMDKTRFAKVRKYIIAVVVLTMLPATYITFNIIRDSLSDRRIQHFVKAELNFPGTYILSHSVDAKTKIISIVAVGKEISKAQQRSSEQQLKEYSLEKYQLHFIQGTESDSLLHQQGHTFAKQQAMTPEQLAQQQVQIEGLQQQLSGYQSLEQNTPAILQEMQPLFTSVSSLALSQLAESKMHEDSMVCVRTILALVGTKGSLSRNERQTMQRWLKARLKVDSVQVVLK